MNDTAYVYFFIPLSDDEENQNFVTVWSDIKNELYAYRLAHKAGGPNTYLADMMPMPYPNEMTLPCVMVEVAQ